MKVVYAGKQIDAVPIPSSVFKRVADEKGCPQAFYIVDKDFAVINNNICPFRKLCKKIKNCCKVNMWTKFDHLTGTVLSDTVNSESINTLF